MSSEEADDNRRNNLRKRGLTWTYHLYVTEGDGTRRQVSKGGFATRKEAETARAEALTAMATELGEARPAHRRRDPHR